jgi:hypothetical protein
MKNRNVDIKRLQVTLLHICIKRNRIRKESPKRQMLQVRFD